MYRLNPVLYIDRHVETYREALAAQKMALAAGKAKRFN
jgi:hypothetical protein